MSDEKKLTPEQAVAAFLAADEAFMNAQNARYRAQRDVSDLMDAENDARRARAAAQKTLLDVLGIKEGK